MLNFTRSWGFGIFTVYWVSKSKCIISSNLRAEGSSGKVLNVMIFVESMVHRSNWRSREIETVGNSRKQSGAARRDRAKIVNPPFFLQKKNVPRNPLFFESATSSFFAESKVRAPTVSNCFPLHFQKKRGLCGTFFFAKKWRIDNFGTITPGRFRLFPTVSDCFRLFPTVSACFSFSGTPVGPVDH